MAAAVRVCSSMHGKAISRRTPGGREQVASVWDANDERTILQKYTCPRIAWRAEEARARIRAANAEILCVNQIIKVLRGGNAPQSQMNVLSFLRYESIRSTVPSTCRPNQPNTSLIEMAARSLASVVARAAVATPSRLALLAPQQNISWSFEELDSKARKLATGLEDLGYTQGSVALSDIPNVAENILLQLALGHLGAAIATPPKDEAALAKLASKHNVRGVVCLDSSAGVLSDGGGISEPLPMVEVGGDGTRPARGVVPFYELVEHCPPRGATPSATESSLLGSYGGAELTHGACLALGERRRPSWRSRQTIACAAVSL